MNRKRAWLCATAVAIFAPAIAAAQTADPAATKTDQVSEVVVTAQKREESLQKVPITVAAFNIKTMAALGVTDTLDIPNLVPGFVITKSLNIALPYLRGVGQSSATIGIESDVALYIDGIYLPEPAAGVFGLNNIERVEVLKGPQGTLFGRNATGGVINIVTRDPSWVPHVDADLGYGDYDTYLGHLYATGPLSDTLAASLAIGGNDESEGYGRNITLNRRIFQSKDYEAQSKLRWKPDDNTTVTANLIYTYSEGDNGTANGIYPGSLAEDHRTRFISPYTVASASSGDSWTDNAIGSLKIEHDFHWARLVNLAAVQSEEETVRLTQNGIPNGVPPAVNGVFPDEGASTFSDELQLLSPSTGPIEWIGGFYFLTNNARLHANVFADTRDVFSIRSRQVTDSYSGFVQSTVHLRPDTRVTLGARYTVDEKDVSGYQYNSKGVITNTFAAALGAIGQSTDKTWSSPSYRASIDHDLTSDTLIYASYNRGFKSGLFNLFSLTNPAADPETLNAYEVGLKNTFFERRLKLNLAWFYYDYNNIQLRSLVPPAVAPLVFNAASAQIKGLDLDFEAVAFSGFTVNGGLEALNAHYVDFKDGACPVQSPTGGNPSTVLCNLSGKDMIRAPKFTANLGFQYKMELGRAGSAALSASDSYNDGYFFEADNRLRQEPFHMVSASLRWTPPGSRYALTLWGKNLANAFVYANAASASSDTYSPTAPRTYGVTASASF